MLTLRHFIPLLGASFVLACNDDEGLGGQCVVAHHEALPESVPAYERAIAVDSEGNVHVAGPSMHLVRAPDGSFTREAEAFGAGYFGEVLLAPSGAGLIVAHAGDGLRVARGEGGSWTTLFELTLNQCSGHPYVERVEAAEDGSILLEGSEGLLRIREGAEPEDLPYAEAWTADGAGLLTCKTAEELTISGALGEAVLPHQFDRVFDMATSPQGRAAILLGRYDEGGLWLVRRSEAGAWDAAPSQLVAWTDAECPDDPAPGTMCSSKTTRVEAADILVSGESLLAFVALKRGRADLTWGCAPVLGSPSFCYWSWQGDHTYDIELWMSDLAAKEPALRRVTLPEAWDLSEAFPVAAPGADGSVHALLGSTYARIACPE